MFISLYVPMQTKLLESCQTTTFQWIRRIRHGVAQTGSSQSAPPGLVSFALFNQFIVFAWSGIEVEISQKIQVYRYRPSLLLRSRT